MNAANRCHWPGIPRRDWTLRSANRISAPADVAVPELDLAGVHRRPDLKASLLFTGPGGGPGQRGGPGVKKGTRTVLSRHNFRRTYHGALANPATAGLRPTAGRVRGALQADGPLTADQLTAQLSSQGRTASRATIDCALVELVASDVAAIDPRTQRWTFRPAAQHPLLEAVDLHGAHDFRHTFSTWLEDAGIPARSSTS